MMTRTATRWLGFVVMLAVSAATLAQPMTLKVATLAPKGSVYHRALQELGQHWRQSQGPGSRFIVYTDGSQGGEAQVVRRMRIGQMHAALITAVGLSEIDPSGATLQSMPMMFRTWDELDHVRTALHGKLEERLAAKGFRVLFWAEAGWVRPFSVVPVRWPDDLRKLKMFAWTGDHDQIRIMKSLGFRPVALETSDIYPALETGLIEVAAVTPLYALASQVYAPASHMLELNWAPLLGAAVITRSAWERMSPQAREALMVSASELEHRLRAERDAMERKSVAAMAARGMTVHPLTSEAEHAWRELALSVYPQIRGSMVPADLFDEVQRLVHEYRNSRGSADQ